MKKFFRIQRGILKFQVMINCPTDMMFVSRMSKLLDVAVQGNFSSRLWGVANPVGLPKDLTTEHTKITEKNL